MITTTDANHTQYHEPEGGQNEHKDAYILRVVCNKVEKKRAYTVCIKLLDKVANEEKEVWDQTFTYNTVKNTALAYGIDSAFRHIHENCSRKALHIITDKVFVKLWKGAFDKVEELRESYKQAIKETHIEKLAAVHDTLAMINIVGFYDTMAYTLEPL